MWCNIIIRWNKKSLTLSSIIFTSTPGSGTSHPIEKHWINLLPQCPFKTENLLVASMDEYIYAWKGFFKITTTTTMPIWSSSLNLLTQCPLTKTESICCSYECIPICIKTSLQTYKHKGNISRAMEVDFVIVIFQILYYNTLTIAKTLY